MSSLGVKSTETFFVKNKIVVITVGSLILLACTALLSTLIMNSCHSEESKKNQENNNNNKTINQNNTDPVTNIDLNKFSQSNPTKGNADQTSSLSQVGNNSLNNVNSGQARTGSTKEPENINPMNNTKNKPQTAPPIRKKPNQTERTGTQKSWSFIKTLQPGELCRIGRDSKSQAAYYKYQEAKNLKDNAINHLLGRSGITQYPAYFVEKKTFNGVDHFLYIQYEQSQLNSGWNWFKQFLLAHPNLPPAIPTDLSNLKRNILMLTVNLFAYDVAPTIDHWVLWSNQPNFPIENARSVAKSVFGSFDFHIFLNPPYLKSIPEVQHFHLLIQDDKS